MPLSMDDASRIKRVKRSSSSTVLWVMSSWSSSPSINQWTWMGFAPLTRTSSLMREPTVPLVGWSVFRNVGAPVLFGPSLGAAVFASKKTVRLSAKMEWGNRMQRVILGRETYLHVRQGSVETRLVDFILKGNEETSVRGNRRFWWSCEMCE